MADFKKQDFTGQSVILDGNNYEECNFTNAKMVYKGGDLPNLRRCNFGGGTFTMDGPAGRTLQFLQALSKDPVLVGLIHQHFPDAFKKQ
jgi:hypothetical protein